MFAPLVLGAVHFRLTRALPAVATKAVGVAGAAAGITLTETGDQAPRLPLSARIRKIYAVPLVSPVTTKGDSTDGAWVNVDHELPPFAE
jgi:hypothetical protein